MVVGRLLYAITRSSGIRVLNAYVFQAHFRSELFGQVSEFLDESLVSPERELTIFAIYILTLDGDVIKFSTDTFKLPDDSELFLDIIKDV